MIASLFAGFRNARNSLIVGSLGLITLYLAVATTWVGFEQPGESISPRLANTLQAAGVNGRWAIAAAVSLLLGEFICNMSALLFFEKLGRRVLTYQLRDFESETALIDRLLARGRIGRTVSAYSVTSIRRIYRKLSKDQRFAVLPADEKSFRFRAVMHTVLYMAPRLMEIRPETYAEQQRLRADAELRLGLITVAPLFLLQIERNLLQPPAILRIATYAVAVAISCYLAWDAFRLWRESNSQIAHGVCGSKTTLTHIIERPRSKYEHDYDSLPQWAKTIHGLGER